MDNGTCVSRADPGGGARALRGPNLRSPAFAPPTGVLHPHGHVHPADLPRLPQPQARPQLLQPETVPAADRGQERRDAGPPGAGVPGVLRRAVPGGGREGAEALRGHHLKDAPPRLHGLAGADGTRP